MTETRRSSRADERVTRTGFAVAVSVSILVVLETSKIATGLPSISRDLHVDGAVTQLLTSGFLLATAIVLVPAGRLGNRFGRRALLLTALLVFVVGSAAAGWAPGWEMLVAGRILQGIGTGLALPQTIGLIGLMPPQDRPRAHASYGVALALANVLGPVVGGVLIALVPGEGGWRALFFANLPVALILTVLAGRSLPRERLTGPRGADPLGVVLLAIGLAALLLPLVGTTGATTDRVERWLLLPVAALAIFAFVRWESGRTGHGSVPVLDLSVFSLRPFRRGLIVAFGWYASVPSVLLLISLFAQGALGLSPLAAGLVSTPFAIGAGIGSFVARRGSRGSSGGRVLVGALVNVLGIVLAVLPAVLPAGPTAITVLVLATFGAGVGGGLFSTGNQVRTLMSVPVGSGGAAGGVQQLSQRIANATGLALTIIVFSLVGGSSLGLSGAAYALGLSVPTAWLIVAASAATIDLVRERRTRNPSGTTEQERLLE